ncbi:DUF448 domain-containing protein [Parasphingorhabdus sp. JC815]|uniref:DUF448 domain-containing protein n=1 Tax=Parasphingorhabdus sp. JC815 TaxID=3232140 RepID=UPI0034592952
MRKLPNETPSKPLDRAPHRKCILTGESLPQEGLVRLALSPDGQIAPDVRAKAPGRGAWISVDRRGLEQAQDKGTLKSALSRAFKTGKVDIPDDLAQQVENALERATLDRLGLEARGSMLLTGSEKIETAARQGDVDMLLHASDAGRDGSAKLDQAWRIGSDREGQDVRGRILPVDRQALSVALGRQNVVHIGIIDHRAAERISHMLDRWCHFKR